MQMRANGHKMRAKKFNFISCKHEKGKDLWQCKLDNIQRKFTSISLRDTGIDLFPSEGGVAFLTNGAYCVMMEGEEDYHLFCDTDREELEERIGGIKSHRIKEI